MNMKIFISDQCFKENEQGMVQEQGEVYRWVLRKILDEGVFELVCQLKGGELCYGLGIIILERRDNEGFKEGIS